MKRYYSVRLSVPLLVFFVSAVIFVLSAGLGVHHAAAAASADLAPEYTVILDAGHGGEDGGAVGVNGVHEKEINLNIALLVQDRLQKNGAVVKMIRETDTAVGNLTLPTVAERKRSDIQHRVQFVQASDPCILVSIHQNYFDQNQYHGAQMFFSENNPKSVLLAEEIRRSIVQSVQPDNTRENKPGKSIYLLEHTQAPAVIVECGFLSNPEEAALLCEPTYQTQMADAIADGVLAFCDAE